MVVSVYELEIYLTETATWCLPVLQTHKGPHYFGSHQNASHIFHCSVLLSSLWLAASSSHSWRYWKKTSTSHCNMYKCMQNHLGIVWCNGILPLQL